MVTVLVAPYRENNTILGIKTNRTSNSTHPPLHHTLTYTIIITYNAVSCSYCGVLLRGTRKLSFMKIYSKMYSEGNLVHSTY